MLEDATDRLALERSFDTLADVQRATLDNLREGLRCLARIIGWATTRPGRTYGT